MSDILSCSNLENLLFHGTILFSIQFASNYLLPTGSEERGVLGVGSIPVAILPSCQDMKTIAFCLHEREYIWVVKKRNT